MGSVICPVVVSTSRLELTGAEWTTLVLEMIMVSGEAVLTGASVGVCCAVVSMLVVSVSVSLPVPPPPLRTSLAFEQRLDGPCPLRKAVMVLVPLRSSELQAPWTEKAMAFNPLTQASVQSLVVNKGV